MTRAFILALAFGASAPAFAEGYLLLESHEDISERDGAQAAELFVYSSDGAIISASDATAQYAAGQYVSVEEGWYFVEVGRYRSADNAVKVYVADGEVTVIPTGWVSVRTPPLDEQPTVSCNQWNAELNAFAQSASGADTLVNTNRGSGVREWGAVQLLAGDRRVFFNEIPTTVHVVAGELNELPTGFQSPVYGQRPQLATGPEDAEGVLRLPLCQDGALQVPAGNYWASAAVPTDVYPYERRDWTEVTVPAAERPERRELRSDRLRYPRFEGDGSVPIPLTSEERESIGSDGPGGGIRLTGFGR